MDDISNTIPRQQCVLVYLHFIQYNTMYLRKPHIVRHPRIQGDGIEEIFPGYPRSLATLAQFQRLQIKTLLHGST